MPAVTRRDIDFSAAHCFGRRPADQGSLDVITNTYPTVRVTDHYPTHNCGPASHDGRASQGSATVFANNLPIHRISDGIDCGDVSGSGSPDVFVGDMSFYSAQILPPPDPNPRHFTAAEVIHIERSAKIARADPANIAAGLTAGEVPITSPVVLAPPAPTVSSIPTLAGEGCWYKLNTTLADALTGDWKETGPVNASNPLILGCFAAIKFNPGKKGDQVPWCAAFAGAMLKKAGLPYLESASSLAYRGYGTPVPIDKPALWRKHDVIVFTRTGGGHIGFIQNVAPNLKRVEVLGGNQGNDLTINIFYPPTYANIAYIGRPCPQLPAAIDVPIIVSVLDKKGQKRSPTMV